MSIANLHPSIIIPTLNAIDPLAVLLPALKEQSLPPFEIIVIDSSSEDGTQELAEREGCVVKIIPRSDFDHGGTRNLGAQLARGDILVFLTQDALPADHLFLERLVQPLQSSQNAATTARQIPYSGATPLEVFARHTNYPPEPHIRNWNDVEEMGIMAFFFSDVASAVRRDAFENVGGFPEGVIVNEDMILCARLLEHAYSVVYQADAVVYHSHEYSLMDQFRRYFDIGVFFSQTDQSFAGTKAEGRGLEFALGQIRFLHQRKSWRWIPRSMLESALKYLAFQTGQRSGPLPLGVKRCLSRQKTFWDRLASSQ
jgi:rhamnosyltransferase